MTDDGARLREVLSGRHRLLARLVDSPADKPALVEALPVARSTVDRGVRDLEEVGCIERSDGRFRASAAGRAALAAFDHYADATDGVAAATAVLASLPPEVDVPSELLVEAEVRVADDHAPERASEPLTAAVRTADRVRSTVPVVYGRYLEQAVAAVDGGADFEVVTARAVDSSAREIDPEHAARLLASDRYDAYVTDASVPFALTLVERGGETTVGVTVYDRGAPRGVILNDTPAAVAWARDHYRSAREAAVPADEGRDETAE